MRRRDEALHKLFHMARFLKQLKRAEKEPKPELANLITDVYKTPTASHPIMSNVR